MGWYRQDFFVCALALRVWRSRRNKVLTGSVCLSTAGREHPGTVTQRWPRWLPASSLPCTSHAPPLSAGMAMSTRAGMAVRVLSTSRAACLALDPLGLGQSAHRRATTRSGQIVFHGTWGLAFVDSREDSSCSPRLRGCRPVVWFPGPSTCRPQLRLWCDAQRRALG